MTSKKVDVSNFTPVSPLHPHMNHETKNKQTHQCKDTDTTPSPSDAKKDPSPIPIPITENKDKDGKAPDAAVDAKSKSKEGDDSSVPEVIIINPSQATSSADGHCVRR